MLLLIRYRNGKTTLRKIVEMICFHGVDKGIVMILENHIENIRITKHRELMREQVFNNGETTLKDNFKENVDSLEIRIGSKKYTFIDFSEEEIEELIKGEELE